VRLAAEVHSGTHIVPKDGGVDGEGELEAVLVAGRCTGSRLVAALDRSQAQAGRVLEEKVHEPVLVAFDLCSAVVSRC
jgi:cytoskeletal protein CcmA (bactofilin family)